MSSSNYPHTRECPYRTKVTVLPFHTEPYRKWLDTYIKRRYNYEPSPTFVKAGYMCFMHEKDQLLFELAWSEICGKK